MRYLIAIVSVLCLTMYSQADEPAKKYYLVDGKVVVLEKKVSDLEIRVKALENGFKVDSKPMPTTSIPTSPFPKTVQPSTLRTQDGSLIAPDPNRPGYYLMVKEGQGTTTRPFPSSGMESPTTKGTTVPGVVVPSTQYQGSIGTGRTTIPAPPVVLRGSINDPFCATGSG